MPMDAIKCPRCPFMAKTIDVHAQDRGVSILCQITGEKLRITSCITDLEAKAKHEANKKTDRRALPP